jgi:c-di-GMP-binding flagellar brake protein YcgR
MLGQRRYERVAFFCPVQLTVFSTGDVIEGNTVDISIGGVGLIAPAFLERGEEVCVRFRLHHGSDAMFEEEALGRVAYSLADEDGNRIGIEFLQTIRDSKQPELARRLSTM